MRSRLCRSLSGHPVRAVLALFGLCFLLSPVCAAAQGDGSQKTFFENSTSAHSFFYSEGKVQAPSTLELIDKKLPLETEHFVSGPNSLKLHWHSSPDGGWDTELRLATWPNRTIDFAGDTLYLWVYSPNGIAAKSLPDIALRDNAGGFTGRKPLSAFTQDLPAGKWVRVHIPFARMASESVHAFQPRRLSFVILSQGATDDAEHTLLLDDIRIENAAAQRAPAPATPGNVHATGYERHVDVRWDPVSNPAVAQYVIYRSTHGGPFVPVGTQRPDTYRYEDFVGDAHWSGAYKVSARTSAHAESTLSRAVNAATHPMSDEQLLDMVQEASFRFYWDGAEPHSGMALESRPGNDDIVAVGGSGFGVMSMIVGAERGFEPRAAIVHRLLHITEFLAHADRFHGVWPHFLSGSTGKVLPNFGIYDDGADLVESSFLMEGLLAARGYFQGDDPAEKQLREQITVLWKAMEWDWFRATPNRDALYWHWSPNYGFHIANRLQGWNEVMITYLLAVASPTHAVPASVYSTGYTAEGNPAHPYGKGMTAFGIHIPMTYSQGTAGPLFFTHYSFMGYDPRGVRDKYANYFVNNRDESLIQQKYAIENPKHFKGYGADSWGYSAVTGPRGYREYKTGPEDDGTIAPTASVSAYAYTPQESLQAIRHFYRDLGAQTWDVYGFRNAWNETEDWYAPDELGLNQGPQAVMIENGRTGVVWRSFMSNPEMRPMQKALGLVEDAAGQGKQH